MTSIDTIEIGYDPPRFWWTKRIVLASVALVGLIVALVFGATHVAQRRLDALIESYRAKGEPVYVEDFNVFKDIPDEENAATYYKQAELAYTWPAGIPPGIDIHGAALRGDLHEYQDESNQLISTNGETISLLKRASRCDEVEWKCVVTRPLLNSPLPNFRISRGMAKLLTIAAEQFHARGQDNESVELLVVQQRLGNHHAAGPAHLVGHMVAVSIMAQAVRVIEHIGAQLQMASDRGPHSQNAASRQQVQDLITELLDESALASSLSLALDSERATLIDAVDFLIRGQGALVWAPNLPRPVVWLIQPVLLENSWESAVYCSSLKAAAELETYPMAMAQKPNAEDLVGGRGLKSVLPAAILMSSLDRCVQLDFRVRANRRMAATALAIRLFEVDRGHRPETLGEMVPDYLDAIPRDPFADGDVPIQYRPNASSPVLYSVGLDGVDDGGRSKLRKGGSIDWDKLDLVFFLDGDRPRGKP